MTKQIVFVSDTLPIVDIGSAIIFHRHFRALVAQGWQITVVTHTPLPPAVQCFWRHVQLPSRLWWWPPVRTRWPISALLRAWLQVLWLRRVFPSKSAGPAIILTQFWDHTCLLASCLSRHYHWPMGVFHHDDEIGWQTDSGQHCYLRWKRQRTARRAQRIWPASTLLIAQLDAASRLRCHLLRPIPGIFTTTPSSWKDRWADGLRLGYAGKTYGAFQPLLHALARRLHAHGGSLHLITDAENVALLDGTEPNLHARPFFSTSEAAQQWLMENCSALLVAHPLDFASVSPAWQILRTSFPSKLPEATQTGLPLLLIGAPDSELGCWAASHENAPFFASFDAPALDRYMETLRTRDGWESAARWSRTLGTTEFSPAHIQADFENEIRLLATLAPS